MLFENWRRCFDCRMEVRNIIQQSLKKTHANKHECCQDPRIKVWDKVDSFILPVHDEYSIKPFPAIHHHDKEETS